MHMQNDLTERQRARGTATVALALLAALTLAGVPLAPAGAVEVPSLYTVEVPFDARETDAQNKAYAAALGVVLVRITGSAAAAESEDLTMLFPSPARFVRQYRPGADGTLVVSLDGPAIERVLRQAGATVWGSDRPLTIVWLAVDWGLGDREIVAAGAGDSAADARATDRNRMLRDSVQAAADRRGIPIVLPLLDAEDMQRIGFIDIWGGFDETLLDASARYDAPSILVGRIRPDDPQPPRWTWYTDEQRFGWPGQPDEAIDQLADALAAREAISGSQESETIEITISGVDSMTAYGRVQSYLEGLRIVDNLAVKSAAPGRITYRLQVQGGADRLDKLLAVSKMFERGDGYFIDGGGLPGYGGGPRTMEYRYRRPADVATGIATDIASDPADPG